MKILYALLLVILPACWNYKDTQAIKYPVPPKVIKEQARQDQKIYAELTKRWQESLPKKSVKIHKLYDLESSKAKKMRSLANAKDLKQTLEQKISLDLLVYLLYERNPGLQNAYKNWQASRQRYSQAFFLQNLLEQYTSFTRTLDTKVAMPRHRPKVSRNAPLPAFLSIMGEVITSEIEESRLHYILTLRNHINQITIDYADLIYIKGAIKIQRQHLQIVKSLEKTARDKFRAGLTSYGDVLKAQILKEQIKVDLKTFKEKKQTIQTKILTALDLHVSIHLGELETLELTKLNAKIAKLYEISLENRQEIQILAVKIKKIEQLIALAKDKLYPDFTIGLSYFENRNKERIGIAKQGPAFTDKPKQMPRFSFGQRNSYIQEMIIKKEALNNKLDNLKQNTTALVRHEYFKVDKHWREYILYRDNLIPLAKEALRVIRIAYQVGKKADFLDVLDAERSLLKLTLSLEKHKRNYFWELANLDKLLGLKLKKN